MYRHPRSRFDNKKVDIRQADQKTLDKTKLRDVTYKGLELDYYIFKTKFDKGAWRHLAKKYDLHEGELIHLYYAPYDDIFILVFDVFSVQYDIPRWASIDFRINSNGRHDIITQNMYEEPFKPRGYKRTLNTFGELLRIRTD